MAEVDAGPPGWWAADKLIAAYLAMTAIFICIFFEQIPGALTLLSLHILGIAAIPGGIYNPRRLTFVFRYWYPLPYVAGCYAEMRIFIVNVRRIDFDAQLAALDFRIWGAHPTVWLERVQSAALTEALQWSYAMFVPSVLLVGVLLWRRGRFRDCRIYAFLVALGFLVSYVGYYLVPARGPRFVLAGLQQTRLEGLWLFESLRAALDQLERAHYDCFPSGHVELTMLACWSSRMISNKLFAAYGVYTASIVFATVYLRYHYTVDVMAGAAIAVVLIFASPPLYRALGKEGLGKG